VNKHDDIDWISALLGGTDVVPRKIGPSAVSTVGRVATSKAANAQTHESLLERDLFFLLDNDVRVEKFASNAFSISWRDETKKLRRYTPDLIVKYSQAALDKDPCLRHLIIEVKPSQIIKRDWKDLKPQWRAAISFSRKYHLKFLVANENRIRTPFLENLKFLRRFRRECLFNDGSINEQQRQIRDMLQVLKKSTPKELLIRISPSSFVQAEHLPWLWQMLYYGDALTDMSCPLNMNSSIWISS
jgi:hypothetical protein